MYSMSNESDYLIDRCDISCYLSLSSVGVGEKRPLEACPFNIDFSPCTVVSAADSKSLYDLDLLFKGIQ